MGWRKGLIMLKKEWKVDAVFVFVLLQVLCYVVNCRSLPNQNQNPVDASKINARSNVQFPESETERKNDAEKRDKTEKQAMLLHHQGSKWMAVEKKKEKEEKKKLGMLLVHNKKSKSWEAKEAKADRRSEATEGPFSRHHHHKNRASHGASKSNEQQSQMKKHHRRNRGF